MLPTSNSPFQALLPTQQVAPAPVPFVITSRRLFRPYNTLPKGVTWDQLPQSLRETFPQMAPLPMPVQQMPLRVRAPVVINPPPQASAPLIPPFKTRNDDLQTLETNLEEQGKALLSSIQNGGRRELLQKTLADAFAQQSYQCGSLNKKIIFVGLIAFAETILKIDPTIVSNTGSGGERGKTNIRVERLLANVRKSMNVIIGTNKFLRQTEALYDCIKKIKELELETKVAVNHPELWLSRARVSQMLAVCNFAVYGSANSSVDLIAANEIPTAVKRKEDREERKDSSKTLKEESEDVKTPEYRDLDSPELEKRVF